MISPEVNRPGDDSTAPTSWFSSLSRSQCEELLAEQDVGRIAWQSRSGLQLLPVSYVWHEGAIVFRTSAQSVMAELVDPTEVVFEVDVLDQHSRTGRSVMVNGRAHGVSSTDDLTRLWSADGPVPWAAGGVRNTFVRITPHQITGRSVVRQS